VKPLPARPFPAPGEALVGYLHRLASLYQTPPSDLFPRIGLVESGRDVGANLAAVTMERLENASSVLRLSTEQLLAMDQRRVEHRDILDCDTVEQLERYAVHHSSLPACPECLASNGVWRKQWAVALSPVCIEHRRLLLDECPVCATPVMSMRSHERRWGVVDATHLCLGIPQGSATRGAACTLDLRTAESATALTDADIEAHSLVQGALRGEHVDVSWGTVSASRFIDDVMMLVQLCMLCRQPRDFSASDPEAATATRAALDRPVNRRRPQRRLVGRFPERAHAVAVIVTSVVHDLVPSSRSSRGAVAA